jgi:hypothetical protein
LAGIFSNSSSTAGRGLGDGLFHGQHAHDVIADKQLVAFRFDVGIDHLVVEKLIAQDIRAMPTRVIA